MDALCHGPGVLDQPGAQAPAVLVEVAHGEPVVVEQPPVVAGNREGDALG